MAKTISIKTTTPVFTTRNESVNRWFRDINKYKPVEQAVMQGLLAEASQGSEKAVHRIVELNLRLVVSLANLYKFMTDLGLEDLISEGSIGLLQAARQFDPQRGYEFNTFAVMMIRQAILQAVEAYGCTIHLPKNATKSGVNFVYDSGDAPRYTDNEGNVTTLWDVTESEQAADTGIYDMDAAIMVAHILSGIRRNKDKEIICKLFGIGYDHEHTAVEIALEYNITEEAVRQLKLRTLVELKRIADTAKELF